jgi:hypothetical protein
MRLEFALCMVFLVSDPLQLGVPIQKSGVDHTTSGDYNLAALDYLPKCDLHWVGNCNELNAGTWCGVID